MKVRELIEELQKFSPDADISVPVQSHTQAYPSGYFDISWIRKSPGENSVRIWVHLPEGFVLSERKKK